MKQASITIQNLEAAFAGESMAHIKYLPLRQGLSRGRRF